MTRKQIALSRLARLALSAESDSAPSAKAELCRTVAIALADDCPDFAQLAQQTAHHYEESRESEAFLLSRLRTTDSPDSAHCP